MGQEKDLTKFHAFSLDPVLICEVGQEMGLKACKASIPSLVDSTGFGPGLEENTDLGPNLRDGPAIGPNLDASEKTEITVLGGSNYAGPSSVSNSDFSRFDFSNEKVPSSMVPPAGFYCQFLAGVWALVPALVIPASRVEGRMWSCRIWKGLTRIPRMVLRQTIFLSQMTQCMNSNRICALCCQTFLLERVL